MTGPEIISQLPYRKPFLFVDELTDISENGILGNYTFRADEYFYEGHFIDQPITPGVILIEVMAQIGVVCLGIFLTQDNPNKNHAIAFTSSEIEFTKSVKPGEKVTVKSEKVYFRFGKLKCSVIMYNEAQEKVCQGNIAGMIINKTS